MCWCWCAGVLLVCWCWCAGALPFSSAWLSVPCAACLQSPHTHTSLLCCVLPPLLCVGVSSLLLHMGHRGGAGAEPRMAALPHNTPSRYGYAVADLCVCKTPPSPLCRCRKYCAAQPTTHHDHLTTNMMFVSMCVDCTGHSVNVPAVFRAVVPGPSRSGANE